MFPVTITLNDAAQLNAVMQALAVKTVEEAPAKKSAKPAASPVPPQPTATVAVADAPAKTASESAQPAAPRASTAATEAPKVAYADLQKAVMKLHALDPKAPVPIANSLGAATFKVLPEDKWAEALKLVQEAIAAKEVA